MKITFISPHLMISGGVLILADYAHHLTLLGHDVSFVVVNKIYWRRQLANFFNYKPTWLKNRKIKIKRVSSLQEKYLPQSDILLVSSYSHAKLIENFSRKYGEKIYLVQHDERLYHGEKLEVSNTYKLAYHFITVSTWLKEMLQRDFLKDAKLLVNTLDKKIFYPRNIQRRDKEIKILMLHHTYEWKGVKEGIDIVNDLKHKYSNIKLVMYGARKEKVDCDEYHYKPIGDEVAKLQSSCDIFLCPSWDEGFGLPSLEAMACKCAVATYDNGGSRDFAFDGQTALVAKRKDKEELKNKLELLIKDKELRDKIAEGAYQFVQNMPTLEQQADKLEKILKGMIKNYEQN